MRRTAVFHLVLWGALAALATAAPAASRHRAAKVEAAADPCAGLSRSDLKACRADQAKPKGARLRTAEEDPCAGLARSDLKACRADQGKAAKAGGARVAESPRDACAKLSRRRRDACEREADAAEQVDTRRATTKARQAGSPEPARAARAATPTKREVQPEDLIGGVDVAAPALRGPLPAEGASVAFTPQRTARRRATRLHEVVLEDGQSLADLAARTGVSVADLAKLNGIASVEDVPTGMKLKLPSGVTARPVQTASAPLPAASPPPAIASPATVTARAVAPPPVSTSAPPDEPAPVAPRGRRAERRFASSGPSSGPRPYASLGAAGSPPMTAPPAAGRWGRTQADAMAAYAVASARAPRVADRPEATHERFVWPLRAQVVSGFGAHGTGQRNDGVDLAARPGDAVRAAAAGEVVYAGKEIAAAGGNLVLLKHADGWVTAYSHLGRLTVAMRQTVDQGQEIAETADVAGASVHFEVRQPGSGGAKPVDPVSVLPVRGGGELGRGA